MIRKKKKLDIAEIKLAIKKGDLALILHQDVYSRTTQVFLEDTESEEIVLIESIPY